MFPDALVYASVALDVVFLLLLALTIAQRHGALLPLARGSSRNSEQREDPFAPGLPTFARAASASATSSPNTPQVPVADRNETVQPLGRSDTASGAAPAAKLSVDTSAHQPTIVPQADYPSFRSSVAPTISSVYLGSSMRGPSTSGVPLHHAREHEPSESNRILERTATGHSEGVVISGQATGPDQHP